VLAVHASELLTKAEFLLQGIAKYGAPASCPYCRSTRGTTLARKALVVRIHRCAECGLCFTRPIYESWLTKNFYDRLYDVHDTTTRLPSPAEVDTLKRTNFAHSNKNFGPLVEKLRPLVRGEPPEALEIGSSWGYCLYQLRAAGFRPVGLEVARARREFGRSSLGVEAVGSWDELPVEREFDLVLANHALEHFTDLTTVFARIARALKVGGLLFIAVPNFDFDSFGRSALPAVGAVHPIGYDAAFFCRNLPSHGLSVVGTFGSWAELPDRPCERPGREGLIVLARKAVSAGAGAERRS
jgi:SAM-dependent methyltransferase